MEWRRASHNDHRHYLHNWHNSESVHLNQVKEMHATIPGIWTRDVLEACHIIKDATNNGIRRSSGSFHCKQEKFVELSGGKKVAFQSSPKCTGTASQDYLKYLGWSEILNVSVFIWFWYFCNLQSTKKGIYTPRVYKKQAQSIPPKS